MKTHQLAKSLTDLAVVLRSLPNVEMGLFLADLTSNIGTSRDDNPNAAALVGMLAAMSRIDKNQWRQLIEKWRLPIEVPRKDSSRNVMGEVMRYLESHPDEIRRIQHDATKGTSRASPALLKALSILLESDKETSEKPQSRD
jgi:hypothetical protein